MERSKHQDPRSRETSYSKHQLEGPVVGEAAWWASEENGTSMVLKDGACSKPVHAFDLEERTAVFGENIVRFAKKIPRHPANDRLIGQLVGCGTSIGANYCEANKGVSKKDFKH